MRINLTPILAALDKQDASFGLTRRCCLALEHFRLVTLKRDSRHHEVYPEVLSLLGRANRRLTEFGTRPAAVLLSPAEANLLWAMAAIPYEVTDPCSFGERTALRLLGIPQGSSAAKHVASVLYAASPPFPDQWLWRESWLFDTPPASVEEWRSQLREQGAGLQPQEPPITVLAQFVDHLLSRLPDSPSWSARTRNVFENVSSEYTGEGDLKLLLANQGVPLLTGLVQTARQHDGHPDLISGLERAVFDLVTLVGPGVPMPDQSMNDCLNTIMASVPSPRRAQRKSGRPAGQPRRGLTRREGQTIVATMRDFAKFPYLAAELGWTDIGRTSAVDKIKRRLANHGIPRSQATGQGLHDLFADQANVDLFLQHCDAMAVDPYCPPPAYNLPGAGTTGEPEWAQAWADGSAS